MTTINQPVFTKDSTRNKMVIERSFDAPVDRVWKAWTQAEILDEWWAPRPFKARTKKMDFRPGGEWIYCMEGPNNEKHWCKVGYEAIDPLKSFSGTDAFCDENGMINNEMPSMHWNNTFTGTGNHCKVTVEITFKSAADMEKIVEMGFKEGFTAGLANLDEWLRTNS
jgi:uncharacterized protein YndB with AHSA1/START domain